MNKYKIMADTLKQNMDDEKNRKLLTYAHLNEIAEEGGILFAGSSLMEYFPVKEMYEDLRDELDLPDVPVYNRGIAGYTTGEFLDGIQTLALDLKPSKIFTNIGTNDMNSSLIPDPTEPEDPLKTLFENYERILDIYKEELPDTEVFLMSYYPVNTHVIVGLDNLILAAKYLTRNNDLIAKANERVEDLAERYGCTYIDVSSDLMDENGQLLEEYTVDGVHLFPNAYEVVLENLSRYM